MSSGLSAHRALSVFGKAVAPQSKAVKGGARRTTDGEGQHCSISRSRSL